MSTASAAQTDRQRGRDNDWHQGRAAAESATGAGLALARQAAATAAAIARSTRQHASALNPWLANRRDP